MRFTGERFVAGKAIGDIVIEHTQRYQMAVSLAEGRDVLDAACGEGYGSYLLSANAKSVNGIDVSAEAVAYAREHYERDNLCYRQASVAELPLADNSVDLVVSFETIEHVEAEVQRQFLLEIRRVLRPGGLLLMSSPDKRVYSDMRDYQNPFHVHELYVEEFTALLAEIFPEVQLFSQGIGNQRVGVIEALDGAAPASVRLVNGFQLAHRDKQYVLALCSDVPLSGRNKQAMVSVLPFVPQPAVRIFVDDGSGFFSGDRMVAGYIESQVGNHVRACFDFGNEWPVMKRLRFDPLEGCGCYCRIEFMQGGTGLTHRPLNACDEVDGYDRFLNDDPQYLFEGKLAGVQRLVIYYELKPIPLEKLWRLLQQRLEQDMAATIQQKDEVIEQKDAAIAAKDVMLQGREDVIGVKDAELAAIYSSRGYRLVQGYYRLRNRMLPEGSYQRRLLKGVMGLLHPQRAADSTAPSDQELAAAVERSVVEAAVVDAPLAVEELPAVEEAGRDDAAVEMEEIQISRDEAEDREALPAAAVFDIVVPVYDAYELTKNCLQAVLAHTDLPYELYIVDDCSTDARIKELLQQLETMARPALMRGLHILANEQNEGFVKSVNRAMKAGSNHVVLLNTDAEVPAAWLSRLAAPLLRGRKVASVTPFSNSATICSFPVFGKDNELPEGMTLAETDALFACCSGGRSIDIPTGVGFCMLLNRWCLSRFGLFDERYGRGYGEENDWCCRVTAAGWQHVLATDLFVYHKHGASFATCQDEKRQQRMDANMAILKQQYPDYLQRVEAFVEADPGREQRLFMEELIRVRQSAGKGILFVNHSMSGGTEIYQQGLISSWRKECRVYGIKMYPDYDSLQLTAYTGSKERAVWFAVQEMDAERFCRLLSQLRIASIYVNHLVTYPLPQMMDWIIASRVPYRCFLHDYYAVCPQYNLLNTEGQYCDLPEDRGICDSCLQEQDKECQDIARWRDMFGLFLQGASEVLVPSRSTADIVGRCYPDAALTVQEHVLKQMPLRSFQPEFVAEEVLQIAILGVIGVPKGAAIVRRLVESIRERHLPMAVKVIGFMNDGVDGTGQGDEVFMATGAYENGELSALLAHYRIGLVLIPSIVPETYSYTTSEAIAAGYPVMAFDLGAPAERIRRYGCGWLVDEVQADALLDRLGHLLENRGEIVDRAAATHLYDNGQEA